MFNALIQKIIAFFKKLFGSQSDREFKRSLPQVDEINQLAAEYKSLSDGELQAKTAAFRADLAARNAERRGQLDEREPQPLSHLGHRRDEVGVVVGKVVPVVAAFFKHHRCRLTPVLDHRVGAEDQCRTFVFATG